jgi:hypothetical protein
MNIYGDVVDGRIDESLEKASGLAFSANRTRASLNKKLAPQVGLEPTTLRLTAGEHMLDYTYSQ